MKNNPEEQLAAIHEMRDIMKNSSRFLTLSGLSGILAGVYALIGAFLAGKVLRVEGLLGNNFIGSFTRQEEIVGIRNLAIIGLSVMLLALVTGFILTKRNTEKKGQLTWGPVSRQMLFHIAVPLACGGMFSLMLIRWEIWFLVPPAMLIFYGLALISGSKFTYKSIQFLGFAEILLGFAACFSPQHSLQFWALGFGVFHIIYGALMYFKYER